MGLNFQGKSAQGHPGANQRLDPGLECHAEWGHRYSEFLSWWLPVLVVRSPIFWADVPQCLLDTFEAMSDLLKKQVSTRIPSEQVSGSTCVVVVKRAAALYTAYLGDSRAVAYDSSGPHALTED